MKRKYFVTLNFIAVASLFSQAALAGDNAWLTSALSEPLTLSLCGVALLLFGAVKGRQGE